MAHMSEFGMWLHAETKRSGLFKRDLAFHSGITPQMISSYVRGKASPTMLTFRCICEALAYFQGMVLALSRPEIELLSDQLMVAGLRRI